MEEKRVACNDTRVCFGKRYDPAAKEHFCKVLEECYKKDGDCPFCKPKREETNGKLYPYDPDYGKGLATLMRNR